MIAQKILNLKIELNEKDIEVSNLHGLLEKISVINNIKSRKTTEKLLKNIIHEYGYQLQTEVKNMKQNRNFNGGNREMNGKEYQKLPMRTNDGNANYRLRQGQVDKQNMMLDEFLTHILDYLVKWANLMT